MYLLIYRFACLFIFLNPPAFLIGQQVDSLKSVAYSSQPDTSRLRSFFQLMDASAEAQSVDSLEHLMAPVKELVRCQELPKWRLYGTKKIGTTYLRRSAYDSAFQYLVEAKELAKEFQQTQEYIGLLFTLQFNYRRVGDTAKLPSIYTEMIEYGESEQVIDAQVLGWREKGTHHYQQAQYAYAQQAYSTGLEIAERVQDTALIAEMLEVFGVYFGNTGDSEKEQQYLLKAATYFNQLNDQKSVKNTYRILANSYFNTQDYAKAAQYASLSYDIATSQKSLIGTLQSLEVRAKIYIKQDSLQLAKKDIQEGLDLIKKMKYYREFFEVGFYELQGDLLADHNIYLAINSYTKAYSATETTNSPHKRAGIAKKLGIQYAENQQFEKAVSHFQTYLNLESYLKEAEKEEEIQQLLIKFDTERLEREQERLQTENALIQNQLRLQKLELKQKTFWILCFGGLLLMGGTIAVLLYRMQQNKMKQQIIELQHRALRTQMNPHFIFNALGSIQAFFLKNDQVKGSIFLHEFGELVRRVLEHSAKNKIPLSEELQTIELYLNLEKSRMGERLTFKIEVDERIDPTYLYVPPMVLQPFLENAVWHGLTPKPEGGHIHLFIHQTANELVCEVKDNGIGVNHSLQRKEPSQLEHVSQGISVTRSRLDLVESPSKRNSRVEIQQLSDELGKVAGTHIKLYLPLIYDAPI
ncbi:MAG: histidine kinase [Bacteroidota bacterium]